MAAGQLQQYHLLHRQILFQIVISNYSGRIVWDHHNSTDFSFEL
jgi:hypothetical protein